jgi:hypothetical protein
MWAPNLVGRTIMRRSSEYAKTKERKTSSTKPWMVTRTQPIRNSNLAHILMGTSGMLRVILLQAFRAMHPFLFLPHCNSPNQCGRKNGRKKQQIFYSSNIVQKQEEPLIRWWTSKPCIQYWKLMVIPNGHEQRLRDVWSPVLQRTDKMELGQVVHQMIPWILPIEG